VFIQLYLQGIIKAHSLTLVGADTYKVQQVRTDGTIFCTGKYTLPHPTRAGGGPRYGSGDCNFFSPDRKLGAKALYNVGYIDAVVRAVQGTQV
jgi:hypothetical protein